MKRMSRVITLLLLMCLLSSGCGTGQSGAPHGWEADYNYASGLEDVQPMPDAAGTEDPELPEDQARIAYCGEAIPDWDGETAFVNIHGGEPWFDAQDLGRTDAFETYSELDGLGRCGQAYANVCLDTMPTEERGEIGSVRPSGWHTVRYDGLVDGNYLYNRCHLIGFQLAGENANEKNLVTGTRYLNIQGMLDLENSVADAARDGMHVLYRVTPVFLGSELVCRGLVIEAYSVEDGGEAVRECRFAYNAQPGILIDYATGESRRADGRDQSEIDAEAEYGPARDYVVNTSSGKIHLPDCVHAAGIGPGNRLEVRAGIGKLHAAGYSDCGTCRPGDAG